LDPKEDGDRQENAQGSPARPTIGHNGGPPLDDGVGGPRLPKLAFTIPEAVASAGISRSLLYLLLRDKKIRSFRVDGRRRRLIYVDDLRAWLLSEREAGGGTPHDFVRGSPDKARDGAAPTRSSRAKR
jgi:excisionase family DNA binding protein